MDKKELKIIDARRPSAPKWLGYIVAFLFLGILILGILTVVYWKQGVSAYLLGGTFTGIVALEVINWSFSWVRYQKLYIYNDKLVYNYQECVDFLGNDMTDVTIFHVDRIHKGLRHLVVYGDFEIKEPMRKTRAVKKFKVFDYTDDTYNFFSKKFGV